jgi:RimJ/RimL family protein N-acetyltransferase
MSAPGDLVDAAPRPLPPRLPIRGAHVVLEPLHKRHAADLWEAAQGADASWTWMAYGPFPDRAALQAHIEHLACQHDPMVWAARSIVTGRVSGWLALMDIRPEHASIELGHIWFAPVMQRTRAATEAMSLLLRLAADELGYRRLVWRCDSLNAPSRRAAQRLGFIEEGILRADRVAKGKRRDTASLSIIEDEWLSCRDAILAWLDPANFDAEGNALSGLADLRARQRPGF